MMGEEKTVLPREVEKKGPISPHSAAPHKESWFPEVLIPSQVVPSSIQGRPSVSTRVGRGQWLGPPLCLSNTLLHCWARRAAASSVEARGAPQAPAQQEVCEVGVQGELEAEEGERG